MSPSIPPTELRWRVVNGQISLLNRHYRALEPLNLPEPLRAWIHERLEWAADNMLYRDRDAVICLTIDSQKKDVVVSVEELRLKPKLSQENICHSDDVVWGVKHQDLPLQGSVWLEKNGELTAARSPFSSLDYLTTATDTLALQLAETLSIPTKVQSVKIEELSAAAAVFLLSDEFGFIPISGAIDQGVSAKMSACFKKVFEPEQKA